MLPPNIYVNDVGGADALSPPLTSSGVGTVMG